MDDFLGSQNFVIDKDLDFVIQNHKDHVRHLFGVTLKLENSQRNKRWINLRGPEDKLIKAKEYILALTNPEITSIVENVLNNPNFSKDKQTEIERKSSAVLSRYDDKSATSLQIKGTAFSVTIAKSLIEEVLCVPSSQPSGIVSPDEPVMDEAEEDCIITEARLMNIPRDYPKSSAVAEPQIDRLNMKFKHHLDSALIASKSLDNKRDSSSILPQPISQPENTVSFLSPHGREQQAYLRNLAMASKYDKDSIEKALLKFDMNDVIPPAKFISAVMEISQQNATKSKQSTETKGMDLNGELDASVICLDSSDDEETYVMRPFQGTNQCERQTDSKDTIVLSSDDEQENERPGMVKSNQPKLYDKGKSKNQPSYLVGFHEVPFFSNTGPRSVSSSLTENPRNPSSDNSLLWLLENNTSNNTSVQSFGNLQQSEETHLRQEYLEGSVQSFANSQQSEETRLRQEYLEGLMRAAPKFPKTGPRYIVIDGSNVAMSHGNNVQYSAVGIEICIKYFLSRGHNNITAFVPEWRRYTNQISSDGRALLEKLNKAGFVKFTPARRVGNRTIASYDDRFILNLAVEEEGIIVSNDQYRDLQVEQASYKEAVTNRLLQYTFVGNHFMPPDDPLGRFGPSLDQFLHYPAQPSCSGMETMGACAAPPRGPPDGTAPKSATDKSRKNPRMLPIRTKAETENLFLELIKVFPEPHQLSYVRKVLANHKRENDLNRLSIYCINAMTS